MEKYKERLILEEDQLDDKINKIIDFIGTEKYYELSFIKKWKIRRQLSAMLKYDSLLMDRIKLEGISECESNVVITKERLRKANEEAVLNDYKTLKNDYSDTLTLLDKKERIIIDNLTTISHLKKEIEEYKAALEKVVKPKKTKKNDKNKEN